MILPHPLKSKRLCLRTAEPDDAVFVLGLRTDPELSRFLKPIDPSLPDQKEWIRKKKDTQGDYHMIMEDTQRKNLGVIALYDIKPDGSFDWGRWVISREAPFYTAYESMILLYEFAFTQLQLQKAYFEVRKQNVKVLDFHRNYGAEIKKTDEYYHWFEYRSEQFEGDDGMQSIVKGFA